MRGFLLFHYGIYVELYHYYLFEGATFFITRGMAGVGIVNGKKKISTIKQDRENVCTLVLATRRQYVSKTF